MEQIEKIKQSLRAENKVLNEILLDAFANAMFYYVEAKNNIQRNGTIVAHPKTGAPIENPYNKILKDKLQTIKDFRMIKSDITFAKIDELVA